MQKGQIRSNAALSSMFEISCLPASTAGARNLRLQLLQVTDFCATCMLPRPLNIVLIQNGLLRGNRLADKDGQARNNRFSSTFGPRRNHRLPDIHVFHGSYPPRRVRGLAVPERTDG